MKASESLLNDQSTATENALRRAVDTTPAFVHTARPDGYLDYFNRGWLDFLGKSLEEVSGWRWTDSLHPEDVATLVQKWHAALASGEPFEIEARVRRADGSYRALLHRKLPLRDEHGSIVKWFGSSIDIEDRKRAEEQFRRSTQELQRSEFYLAEGQRLAQMGSWAFDAAGFDYWSPELFRIYGLEPTSTAPTVQEYLNCIHPDDREFMANLIKGILATASPFDATKRIVRPDGELRYIRCVGAPVFENQKLKKYIGSALDVTEHELLTQELQRREAYLAEAQRLSHTGSFGWDVSSGEIYWSDETFRIFELDPKTEVTTELIVQRTHPDDRQAVQQIIERASRERTEFALEHRLLIPDGSIKYLQVVGRPSTDEGHRSEFVGAVTDITNHRQAEEKIREQEIELRQILDLTPHHLYVFGPDGGLLYVNQFALAYLGADLAEMVAPSRINFIHPDDRPGYLAEREKGLLAGKSYEFELRILRRDGTYRWFLGRGNPLKDEQGRITRWYNTATDIEDRKQAEEEIRKENIALREELSKTSMFEEVIGTSSALQMVLARAAKVAPTDSTVLIMGETGTGKELIARAIHKRSKRGERSFVGVNCAA